MQRAIDILTDGQPPRTWSILVTIFGDLALSDGARLSGQTLGDLTAPMGIRPEALRTALHRLRNEGWIESQRDGRTTTHALTVMARIQSRAAGQRIYAVHPPENLYLSVHEPGGSSVEGYPVGTGLSLTDRPSGFSLPVDHPPDWMKRKICSPDLLLQTNETCARLKTLMGVLEPDLAVRILVVHTWRRLVLRTPVLPDRAFPTEWNGSEARMLFHQIVDRLPKAQLAEPITRR